MPAAAGGLRVAARRVDHRDVVVDLVGGVQRLGLWVEDDRLGVGSGVDLGGMSVAHAAGWLPLQMFVSITISESSFW